MKNKSFQQVIKECQAVHKVWYDFIDHFKKCYYRMAQKGIFKNKKVVLSKRKYKEFDINKMVGYDAMTMMDKFVSANKSIIPVRCDDSTHSGSSLYLIPHESRKDYMGTTVLFIPQCTKEQNNFFLYPDHLDKLIKELQKIQKRTKKKIKDE